MIIQFNEPFKRNDEEKEFHYGLLLYSRRFRWSTLTKLFRVTLLTRISKNQDEIFLTDIIDNFPLNGDYYFRFKYKVNGETVWMDIPSAKSKLPLFEEKIMLKATRL